MFENRRNLGELLLDGLSNRILGLMRARSKRKGDFHRIVVPIDDLIGLRVMATGRWELTSLDAVRTLIESPERRATMAMGAGTFIDIGANIGLYSIALAKYFDRVIAFEANPVTFKVLDANLALSGAMNVQSFCEGVSSRKRRTQLYTPTDGNLGWATLDSSRHGTGNSVIENAIDVDTLDSLSEKRGFGENPISLIKIDVEGHEAEVLRGAVGILNRWAPVVLFEVLAGPAGMESLEILNQCGYSNYYSFRRGAALATGARHSYLKGLLRGLPVSFDKYDALNPRPAALVCAMKSEQAPACSTLSFSESTAVAECVPATR